MQVANFDRNKIDKTEEKIKINSNSGHNLVILKENLVKLVTQTHQSQINLFFCAFFFFKQTPIIPSFLMHSYDHNSPEDRRKFKILTELKR